MIRDWKVGERPALGFVSNPLVNGQPPDSFRAKVVNLELIRRHGAEYLVDATVVKPINVVERRPLEVLNSASGPIR